jgi:hypothetical protein
MKTEIQRWDQFEIALRGPQEGNPFLEVSAGADFRQQNRSARVDGFYDGDGVYRIRFMPDEEGEWTYTTFSNRQELANHTGALRCVAAKDSNHGPVQVANTFHFSYADRTPYRPFGTTCYAWAHQEQALQEQTLSTFRHAPFNKMRMCIFPKSYVYNNNEPPFYPFPRSSDGINDFSRFNPAFFQHLEWCIRSLLDLGIEADLILFHPYDRWGYSKMPADVDGRYLRYTIARFAAFRNVWWSVANEYDLVKSKTMADWDRFFRIIQASDPYGHLRSIHHSKTMYDHGKPWVTHCSIQGDDFGSTQDLLSRFQKPVIYDECKYEGNIPRRWGNISAEEMVRRFWLGITAGAYVGHGETYLDPHDVLWWSKGGVLKSQSPPRIAFLRQLLESAPPEGLNPTSDYYQSAGRKGKYYLYYFDLHQPKDFQFELDNSATYSAELIDPWRMETNPLSGSYKGKFSLQLPGKPYLAVCFRAL